MALGSLDFGASPGGTLAFGAGGSSGPPPASVIVDADIGALDAGILLGRGHALSLDADIGALDASIGLVWDAGVSRGYTHRVQIGYQDARPITHASAGRYQDAAGVLRPTASRWQDSRALRGAAASGWQDPAQRRTTVASQWQDGHALRGAAASAWQDPDRRRAALAAHWQDGRDLRRAAAVHYQEMARLRHTVAAAWQQATPLRRLLREDGRNGTPARQLLRTHWQDARKPPPGRSWHTIPPEPPHLCYDLADLGKLQFGLDTSPLGVLAFWCKHDQPPAVIVIPARRAYIVLNELSLRRVDGDLDLFAQNLELSVSEGDWTWSWSATLRRQAWSRLQELMVGQPVEVEARINGVAYRLDAEEMTRDTVFSERTVSVRGRGKAARLDAPHAPVLSFTNAAPRTAQQLMQDVLTMNGVPIGWSVDWGLDDWLVPAGAWVHRGSYISAINAIATAAGGYVQPHPTDQVLRILHRYPVAPWDWAGLSPDIELPWDVTEVEGVQVINKPAYNFVIVHGETAGRAYEVTRRGTAGDEVADTIVEPLATAAALGRQRGRAVLSDTGAQAMLSLSMPVLPATGLIMPGKFLRRTGGGEVWQGYTRSLRLSTSAMGALRQTIEVQTHV